MLTVEFSDIGNGKVKVNWQNSADTSVTASVIRDQKTPIFNTINPGRESTTYTASALSILVGNDQIATWPAFDVKPGDDTVPEPDSDSEAELKEITLQIKKLALQIEGEVAASLKKDEEILLQSIALQAEADRIATEQSLKLMEESLKIN